MSILDLIYPKKCLECKENGHYLCTKCIKKVRSSYPTCPNCNKYSFWGKTHKNCKKKYDLDELISLWKYEGVVRKGILVLKYKFVSDVTKELSDLITKEIKKRKIIFGKDTIIIPVPLHKNRHFFRGFNQSEEIVKKVSQKLGLKFMPDLVVRTKNTSFQTSLTKNERLKNIKNAFKFNCHYKIKNKDKKVIIFDDVWTTGATVKEIARVLKKKGISKVSALTITKR